MKKLQTFLLGVITTFTALWPILSASYIALVLSLGWLSLLIFPLLYVLTTLALIYLYKDVEMTIDDFIEKKIANQQLKIFFLGFFKKSKYVALIFASFWLCPLITPILTKLCIKGIKRVYIVASLLNFIITIIWICFYIGGLEIFKQLIGIK